MIGLILENRFLQYAILAGLLSSVLCGIIGVIVVEKKLVMMSGGIAHTAYGGVGLGYLLGIEPVYGAFAFALAAAAGMGFIKRRGTFRSDVIIGLFWSFGMALGILFISLTPGYAPDPSSYLFGNILSVSAGDLVMIAVLALVVFLAVATYFNDWKAYLFDEQYAGIKGIRVALLDYVLFALIALTVVSLLRVVGIFLVITLLTAPAAIAALLVKEIKRRMLLSGALGTFFCLLGLWISFVLNMPSGASIVITAVLSYLLVWGASAAARGRKRQRQVQSQSQSQSQSQNQGKKA